VRKKDVLEIVELLKHGSEVDEEKLEAMLSEYFGIAPDENRAYKELHAVVKERGGDTFRLGQQYFKMKSRDDHRRREAMVKLTNAMHQRQSGRHQLSEFAGGPGQAEGGPASAVVVGKEAADDVRRRLERAIVDATAEVKLSPVLKVLVSPRGDFYRLEYAGEAGPEGYARFGAFPIWAVETHDIEHAVELAVRGLAMGKIAKERKAEHPLAQFFGSWSGSAGQTVQT